MIERLEKFLKDTDASVGITFRESGYVTSAHWGREAPDSPMVGAASYGLQPTLEESLDQMLKTAGY